MVSAAEGGLRLSTGDEGTTLRGTPDEGDTRAAVPAAPFSFLVLGGEIGVRGHRHSDTERVGSETLRVRREAPGTVHRERDPSRE